MRITPEVIAEAKTRYTELKAAGQEDGAFEAKRDATPQPPAINTNTVVLSDEIPGGWYWHGIVKMGETLSIEAAEPSEGVSFLCWSAADPSERLNPPDTIKVQWTAAMGRGRVLLSDMGRAMVSITGGPEGAMDCIAGISTPHANAAKYGDKHIPSAADHFVRAAAKHGLSERDVSAAVTLFAPVTVREAGALGWAGDGGMTGRFDLRAEMDILVALSNCPHPLGPSETFEPAPIGVTVWASAPVPDDDLCRTATPEAERAFENNAALRTGGRR
ncbi:MAG: urea amidolyase associated protein UAAP1 [Pseudomonadota bacterium]